MVRIPGSHAPNIKNRSSKHLIWFTKMKPALWSMSNEALQKLVSRADRGNAFEKELERRERNRIKRKTPRPTKIKEA